MEDFAASGVLLSWSLKLASKTTNNEFVVFFALDIDGVNYPDKESLVKVQFATTLLRKVQDPCKICDIVQRHMQ